MLGTERNGRKRWRDLEENNGVSHHFIYKIKVPFICQRYHIIQYLRVYLKILQNIFVASYFSFAYPYIQYTCIYVDLVELSLQVCIDISTDICVLYSQHLK